MNLRDFFTQYSWWGKLIGAFFGYLMSGPPGALFGILVGNFFDLGLSHHFTRPHWQYHAERRKAVQQVFFQATFAVMGYIAKVDGRVSEAEIRMARQLMTEFGLNHAQQEAAKGYFNDGKQESFNLTNMVSYLSKACRQNPELLKLFLDIQYRAAHVDGLNPKKLACLNTLFQQLGFAPLSQQYRFYQDYSDTFQHERQYRQTGQDRRKHAHQEHNGYQQYKSNKPQDSLSYAFAMLDVSPDASKADVKRAYRRLMSRNHPDKLIAQGLPEAMIKVANEKTQSISKAYEQICAAKGW